MVSDEFHQKVRKTFQRCPCKESVCKVDSVASNRPDVCKTVIEEEYLIR